MKSKLARGIGIAAGLAIAAALSLPASTQEVLTRPLAIAPPRPPAPPPRPVPPPVCPAYGSIGDLVARHVEYEMRCISLSGLDKTDPASLDLGVLFLTGSIVEQDRCAANASAAQLVAPTLIAVLLPALRKILDLDDDTRRKQFAGKLKLAAGVLPSLRLDAPVGCLSPRPLARSEIAELTSALALVADLLPDTPTIDTHVRWQSLPELDIEAAVEQRLGGKTIDDFGRTLIVKQGDRQVRIQISPHWSPDDLVNVYATPDGDFGFADGADERMVRLPELAEEAASGVSLWRYLGAFGTISSRANAEDTYSAPMLLFASPEVHGECAPNVDDNDAKRLQRRKLWKTCPEMIYFRDTQTWEKSQ